MYSYIKGIVTLIESNYIVLDNNGIGYLIYTPNPYSFKENEETLVWIYQNIREDEMTLYGFKTKEEKDYIDGYDLDVDKLVFGEILISMPGKTLCKEDCKGICLICGANLNKGECGCDRDILDPRMSVFKDILKNFKEV